LVITARKPESGKPGRRSITDLPDELVVLILNLLQDVSHASVVAMASVCSFFYDRARAIQHRDMSISLSKVEKVILYLNYLSLAGRLSTILTLRLYDGMETPKKLPKLQKRLVDLISRMTGLRDVYWDTIWLPIPASLVEDLKLRPPGRVRLHAFIDTLCYPGTKTSLQNIAALGGSPNLYSFRVGVEYAGGEACPPTVRLAKQLLLSCPNLRKLSLDLYTPRHGCVRFGPTEEYWGLGLSAGERLPPLDELILVDYPWGKPGLVGSGSRGYPEKVMEQDYWAGHGDWSRLRRLTLCDASLATRIAPQLTETLREVSLRPPWYQAAHYHEMRDMADFLQNVPTTLEVIAVPYSRRLDMTCPIIRHGPRLRRLELLRFYPNHQASKDGTPTDADLVALRDGLPLLEEFAFDVVSNGKDSDDRADRDWPNETVDILSSFPRLRHLRVAFDPPPSTHDSEPAPAPAPPPPTAATAEALFRYIRARSSSDPAPLQHLHLNYEDSRGRKPTTFDCKLVRDGIGTPGAETNVAVTHVKPDEPSWRLVSSWYELDYPDPSTGDWYQAVDVAL
jgi:hypothetical protein